MPPQSDETPEYDADAILRALGRQQKKLEKDDSSFYRRVEQLDKLVRFFYFVGALVVAMILWVAWVQISILAMQKTIDERKETVKRVDEMWWMKEHGVTNRDEFQRVNGYPAPATAH